MARRIVRDVRLGLDETDDPVAVGPPYPELGSE
jgi:hypothetical protein